MPYSLREAWPVRIALAALLALTSVGCGSDAHGLSRLQGEEREVGKAVVEYYEASARGDEEAFCDRVYAHEPGSDPWIPPAGSECYRQTLRADTAAADVIVEDVVVKGTTARVRLTAPRAQASAAIPSVHLRRAREVEDVAALLEAAGGSASLFGISSGAALALEAAAVCDDIRQVVCFEPPFLVDDSKPALAEDFIDRLDGHIAAGRHGAAVRQFLGEVDMPRPMIRLMALTPMWKRLATIAPTLPHDMRIVGGQQQGRPLDCEHWAGIAAPVTVIDGGKSPAWMRNGNAHLARVLGADYITLPGQNHMVKAKVLAPAVAAILGNSDPSATTIPSGVPSVA